MSRVSQTSPLSAYSLAAGTSHDFIFDASNATNYAALLIKATAVSGTSTTNGVQVTVKKGVGSTINYPTMGFPGGIIYPVIGVPASQEYDLSNGPYTITLTNLDTTYGVTIDTYLDFY